MDCVILIVIVENKHLKITFAITAHEKTFYFIPFTFWFPVSFCTVKLPAKFYPENVFE